MVQHDAPANHLPFELPLLRLLDGLDPEREDDLAAVPAGAGGAVAEARVGVEGEGGELGVELGPRGEEGFLVGEGGVCAGVVFRKVEEGAGGAVGGFGVCAAEEGELVALEVGVGGDATEGAET